MNTRSLRDIFVETGGGADGRPGSVWNQIGYCFGMQVQDWFWFLIGRNLYYLTASGKRELLGRAYNDIITRLGQIESETINKEQLVENIELMKQHFVEKLLAVR